ncbi:MAG TPA: phosphotransferase [Candidatus Binataceae bacterium]|nr:phosphotransferase [Candidatus Binataceae bacterium]
MRPTYAEIRSRFEAEQQAGGLLRSEKDLPLSYEAITPEWLSIVLAANHPGAKVVSLRLGDTNEGTSSRRRIFLEWNSAGKSALLPESVFCKGTQRLESRYLLGMNGGIEAEVTFYNALRRGLAIEAPRPLFARFDPETFNSIVILEDMTGRVEFCQHATEMPLERAQSQMRLFAALHSAYYESPELSSTLARFNDWEDYFAITVEEAGFGEACQRGFAQAEEVIPPALFRRAGEIWPATLKSVARHRELPRTFLHSDPHLKNWYATPGGEMGLNDWQCACKGNWGRDLSYAITTALTTESRRAWERDLLRLYLDALASSGGPRIGFDKAWTIYRQQTFGALAWWTGTLGQPPEAPIMQPRESSIEFIGRMTRAIDDLDALGSFKE